MASAKKAPPKGFKKVETGIGGFWRPTKEGQAIQGVVGHEVEAAGTDGKPNKYFLITLTDVDGVSLSNRAGKPITPHEGMIVGLGGKTLLPFLASNIGKEVFISYAGLGSPKKGMNPPKLYNTYVSPSEE